MNTNKRKKFSHGGTEDSEKKGKESHPQSTQIGADYLRGLIRGREEREAKRIDMEMQDGQDVRMR